MDISLVLNNNDFTEYTGGYSVQTSEQTEDASEDSNGAFAKISNEITLKILSYLPSSDLNSCRKVCPLFRWIASHPSLLGRQKYGLLHAIFDKFVGLKEKEIIKNQLLQKSFIGSPDESDIVINSLKSLKFSELGVFLPEHCNTFNYSLFHKCNSLLNLLYYSLMCSIDIRPITADDKVGIWLEILNKKIDKKFSFSVLSSFLSYSGKDVFSDRFDYYQGSHKVEYDKLSLIAYSVIEDIQKNNIHQITEEMKSLFKHHFFLMPASKRAKQNFLDINTNKHEENFIRFLNSPKRSSKFYKSYDEFFNLFQKQNLFHNFVQSWAQMLRGEANVLPLFSQMVLQEHSSAELLISFLLNAVGEIDFADKHKKDSASVLIKGVEGSSGNEPLLIDTKTTLECLIERIVTRVKEDLKNIPPPNRTIIMMHLLYLLDESAFLNMTEYVLEKANEANLPCQVSYFEKLINSLCSPLIQLYKFPIVERILNELPGFLSIETMKRLSESLFNSTNFDAKGPSPAFQLLKCISYNPPHAISFLGQLTYETEAEKFEVVKEFLEKVPDYRDWVESTSFRSASFLYDQGKWLMSFLLGDGIDINNDNFQRFLSISELVMQKFPTNICEGIKTGLYPIEDQGLLKGLCLAAFDQLKICKNSLFLLEKTSAFPEVIELLKSKPSCFYSSYFACNVPLEFHSDLSEQFYYNLPQQLLNKDLLNEMFKENIKNRYSDKYIKLILQGLQEFCKKYNVDSETRFALAESLILLVGGKLAHHYFQYFNLEKEDLKKLYRYTFEKFPKEARSFSTKAEKKWIMKNVKDQDLCKEIVDASIEIFNDFRNSLKRAPVPAKERATKKRKV